MVKKPELEISDHIHMPATQLLDNKYLVLLGDHRLWCVASEHSKVKQSAKENSLFVNPFGTKSIRDNLYLSGQLTTFTCSLQILNKNMQNLVLSWMVH